MKIKGEKTINGGDIKTIAQFIEDLFKRASFTYNKYLEVRDEEFQINLLTGFVSRSNKVFKPILFNKIKNKIIIILS